MGFLDGKCAIVTGAATGLGKAFASALACEGAGLVTCDILPEIAAVAKELESESGRRVLGLELDVAKPADVTRLVDAAVETFGGVDVLVNNAAKWKSTPVTDSFVQAVADFDEIMDTNVRGVLLCGRACVPHMIARGGGEIVNVSTYYVLPAKSRGTNGPNTDLYNASKWALNGFTQAWALALKNNHIRVNGMCMGPTDTAMLRGLFPDGPPEAFAATWMKPEQIADQLLALLREGPGGRTGQNVGAWIGEPVELHPPYPAHRAVTG